MSFSAKALSRAGALALLAVLAIELFFHLAVFPGLHGDEAWMGLRALDFASGKPFSLHGMNNYTAAFFSEVVAGSFSLLQPGVFALRLPGAVFNFLAMAVLTAALWKRPPAAFIVLALFASSLLFLFYGRVAWEATAMQNLLLSIVFAAVLHVAERGRAGPGSLLVIFITSAAGVWNHIIFLTVAIALALATTFLVLLKAHESRVRLFLLAWSSLMLQLVLALAMRFVPDGPFVSHDLPALLAALLLIAATAYAYLRFEPKATAWVIAFAEPRAAKIEKYFRRVVLTVLVILLPLHITSFFGAVSGYVMMERVMSYVPSIPEAIGQHLRFAVLLAAVALLAWRQSKKADGDLARNLVLFWFVFFFPALALETVRLQSDRYFIIPQFLFFTSVGLWFEALPWRKTVVAAIGLGFVYMQAAFWLELERTENRTPLDYRYVLHTDTSRHFLRTAKLEQYVRTHGFCRVETGEYFIAQPMQFLLKTGPACTSPRAIHVEYCDSCRGPLPGYSLTPVKP